MKYCVTKNLKNYPTLYFSKKHDGKYGFAPDCIPYFFDYLEAIEIKNFHNKYYSNEYIGYEILSEDDILMKNIIK